MRNVTIWAVLAILCAQIGSANAQTDEPNVETLAAKVKATAAKIHAEELANKVDAEKAIRAKSTIVGQVKRHEKFQSAFLPTPKDIIVWLPPGYDDKSNAEKRYPTLYLLDGQNVFDGATSFIAGREWRADESATELITKKQIVPVIIVAISNAGLERANEYLPTRDPKFQGGQGGLANNFVSFLCDELRPFLAKSYRVSPKSKDNAVAGSSFGGICALHVVMSRPNTFARAAVMSPSVWWDGRKTLKLVEMWTPYYPLPTLWLDMGTNEAGANADSNQRTLADARSLRDALTAKGWTLGTNLRYVEAAGDTHNEDAWARRLPDALRFLFPAKR